MKRALLFFATVFLSSNVYAQAADPAAALKSYATKLLPRCPAGALTLDPIRNQGPRGFNLYHATLRSTDEYCGGQKYILHSPASGQVLVGTVIPLPADNRPAHVRIAETTSQMLNQRLTASVAPFPLPDGVKAVTISRETPYGPFAYHGFVDATERFLIIGLRGNLKNDAAKTLLDTLDTTTAVRRGKKDAKVEIIELSDFQCPTCARAHEKLEPIIKGALGKISYARIDLPLFEHHEWAIPAAMGGRAIQRVAPTKYWQYVDYVFKNQEQISKRKFDDVIREWAEDNDVAWKSLEPIYRSATERKLLLEQVSRAFDIGINSTPTFIINGQIMGFGPDGTFTINAIKAAINGAPAAAAKPAAAKKK